MPPSVRLLTCSLLALLVCLLAPQAVRAEPSTTNLQVKGVDEPDLVKNDARYIYTFSGQALVIVAAVPPTALAEVGRAALEGTPLSLFLAGTRVVALSRIAGPPARTKLSIVNVKRRKAPILEREIYVEGDFVAARRVGSRVHLVTAVPPAGSEGLPCVESTLTLTTLKVSGSEPPASVWVVGQADAVYASRRALYLASHPCVGSEPSDTTDIHKFQIGGSSPAYVAAGQVEGWVLNQFSMDEHEGALRVATTVHGAQGEHKNHVFVLRRLARSDRLYSVGEIRGVAPGEVIVAVRFIGDRAFVVTAAKDEDPLFAIDMRSLSIRGELKVDGFSTYLHPMGSNHLIAVGQAADADGRVIGLDITIFDVSDLSNPTLAHRHTIPGAYSAALHEHKAFNHLPLADTLAIPVSDPALGFSGLEVFDVAPTSGITSRGRIDHSDLAAAASPEILRSLVIDDVIYSTSDAGIKAHDVRQPELEYGRVVLPQ